MKPMEEKQEKLTVSQVIRRWNLRVVAVVTASLLVMSGICAWAVVDAQSSQHPEQNLVAAQEPQEDTTSSQTQESSLATPAEEESAEASEFTWNEEEIEPKTLYVTETVRLRSTPDFDDETNTIKCLDAGTAVTVIATTDLGYYKCDETMWFGYLSMDYLTDDAPAFSWTEVPGTAVKVATDTVNKRSEPRTSAEVVGQVENGEEVNVVASAENFYKLEDGSWVYAPYFTDPVAEAPAAQSSTSSAASSSSGSATQTTQSSGSTAPSPSAPVVNDGTPQGILNSAPLNPRSTGYAATDAKIQEIFNQIFTSGMTTYDKVKACYDYIITHTSYARGAYVSSAGFGSPSEGNNDAYIAWGALSCLTLGKGSCNTYSCAFIAMMKMIGLDAAYVSGSTHASGGGYVGHNWVEVYIGGQTYVFDPQVEDNISGGGTYQRFCKTYAQVSGKYVK